MVGVESGCGVRVRWLGWSLAVGVGLDGWGGAWMRVGLNSWGWSLDERVGLDGWGWRLAVGVWLGLVSLGLSL